MQVISQELNMYLSLSPFLPGSKVDNEMAEAAASPQHYKYTLKELSTDSRLLPRWHTEEEKMMVLASFAY